MSLNKYKYSSFTMVLCTYNEEARIKRVIEYYKPFAELIVVDNYSTDKTPLLLEKLGVNVIQYKNYGSTQTPEFFELCKSITKTEYLLLLSCSEFISPSLIKLFDKVASKKQYDVVSCVRDSYTAGELIPLWGGRFKAIDTKVERFYNLQELNIDKIVIHGHFEPLNKERVLSLPREKNHVIIHIRDADTRYLIDKSLGYAYVEAKHRDEQGKRIGLFKLFLFFLRESIRFLHLPPSKWNGIALREVWARMVMHSITYWLGWEIKNGMGREYSYRKSEELWQSLTDAQQMPGKK